MSVVPLKIIQFTTGLSVPHPSTPTSFWDAALLSPSRTFTAGTTDTWDMLDRLHWQGRRHKQVVLRPVSSEPCLVHFRANEELWQLQGKASGSHQIQPPDLRNAALSKKTDNE